MRNAFIIFFCLFSVFFSTGLLAQQKADSGLVVLMPRSSPDSSMLVKNTGAREKFLSDTLKPFDPGKATLRSAIIPGWGQAYNKQYWKIPLVYGALGTTAAIFFYNLKTYNQLRKAYSIRLSGDSSRFGEIDPSLQNLSTPAIGSYRTEFRQNIDYSVLFFMLFWGLNVVDATVSAHLKAFDVSDDLSLRVRPHYDPFSNTSGLSLVLSLRDKTTQSR